MPITLVTGLPGHGKTLYTLARWRDEAKKENRLVFHNDIKGLKIPGWQTWDVKDWQNLPSGAIMVVDEAQFAFPTRGRGAPDPWVEKLATHRHLGLDFVVITQNPMLLDSFVRRLVDRHFHVVRKWGTHSATIHEFTNGVKEGVGTSREGSIRHEWRYPKDVFDLYVSAEQHTVKRRIPMRVYLLFALPVLLGALIWFIYQRMKPENVQARMNEQVAQSVPGGLSRGSGSPASSRAAVLSPVEYAQSFQPRVEGLPHTAPVYDEVTKPAVAPYPAACLATKVKCGCYTQQATKLDTPDALCRQIAAGGFFIAWSQQVAQAVPLQQPDRPQAAPQAAPQHVAMVVPTPAPSEPVQRFRHAAR